MLCNLFRWLWIQQQNNLPTSTNETNLEMEYTTTTTTIMMESTAADVSSRHSMKRCICFFIKCLFHLLSDFDSVLIALSTKCFSKLWLCLISFWWLLKYQTVLYLISICHIYILNLILLWCTVKIWQSNFNLSFDKFVISEN